jgi:hypothetical protein
MTSTTKSIARIAGITAISIAATLYMMGAYLACVGLI